METQDDFTLMMNYLGKNLDAWSTFDGVDIIYNRMVEGIGGEKFKGTAGLVLYGAGRNLPYVDEYLSCCIDEGGKLKNIEGCVTSENVGQ